MIISLIETRIFNYLKRNYLRTHVSHFFITFYVLNIYEQVKRKLFVLVIDTINNRRSNILYCAHIIIPIFF